MHLRWPLWPLGALARGRTALGRTACGGALAASGALLTACGGVLAAGRAQFDAGAYPQAKQTFASIERAARDWSAAQRAQYALYRGLTLDALGDEEQASPWLRRAAAIEASRPGALSPEDARRLDWVERRLSDGDP